MSSSNEKLQSRSGSQPRARSIVDLANLRGSVNRFLYQSSRVIEQHRLRSMLGQFILIRIVILTGFLGFAAWEVFAQSQDSAISQYAFVVIAITFGLSAVNALWLRFTSNVQRCGYAQFVFDVLLVTSAAYATGSAVASVLYLLVIFGGAIAFQKHGAVVLASLSGIGFAVLQSGFLPALAPELHPASAQDILAMYVSFIAAALVGSYLAEQAQTHSTRADQHARELTELEAKQQQLIEHMSEGVITVDNQSCILGFNESARSILEVADNDRSASNGRSLPELFAMLGGEEAKNAITKALLSSEPQNITLRPKQSDKELHLRCIIRPTRDQNGTEVGKLLILNDQSRVRSMEEQLLLHERMTQLLASADAIPMLTDQLLQDARLVGESSIMKQVFSIVERVAPSDANVLVTGESGTGKELIAQAIHTRSLRQRKPFVAINCGAIPENLIESELFGHKKGSFTGAVSDNPGLFKQAQGGTIFLDEVGELPLHLQTKLLRVLQEKKVRAVGDVHDISVDVRVVAATNRDLKKEIQAGRFREDLYYRLNVVNVIVPSLRDRKEDIPVLVRFFIGKYSQPNRPLPSISPDAIQLLNDYPFPGNVRELENIVERALVLGGQAVLPEHLPDEVRLNRDLQRTVPSAARLPQTTITVLPINLEGELEKLEKSLLVEALAQSGGVKKQAAELLGLNFRSFRYRLKKYDMGGDDLIADEEK